MRIATVNVNGLRAAARKGLHEWVAECRPDVVTLQEVRAPDEMVADLMGEGWHVVHAESRTKGRAGVAVASRLPIVRTHAGADIPEFADTGRWIEAGIRTGTRTRLTVVSAYAHTGDETSPVKMAEKLAWFEAATARLAELRAAGGHV
ncbi:MAG: endonuclease/exonuclease/phosphatase family protein, partial [Actinomycetota bacterium]